MSLTLGSNIASLKAQQQLNRSANALSKTYERLASGLRINHASDDSAGLAVAGSLNFNARLFGQAIRNVNDGISALNVGEGGLQNLSNIVQRQLELATQSANGSLSATQRSTLDTEANSLVTEFNRIVAATTFNGTSLLSTLNGTLTIQEGPGRDNAVRLILNKDLHRSIAAGGFTQQGSASLPTSNAQASDDLNNDGFNDIVYYAAGATHIKWGNGDGTFSAAQTVGTGSGGGGTVAGLFNWNQIIIADMNDDGQKDVVTFDGSHVWVTLNTGSKTFNTTIDHTSLLDGAASISAIAVGDFNGDGINDLAAATDNGGGFGSNYLNTVLLNADGSENGSIMSLNLLTNGFVYNGTGSLHVADFNGDGITDILLGGDAGVWAIGGFGDGSFNSWATSISGSSNYNLATAVGDFNGDGKIDVVSGEDGVYFGAGDGSFGSVVSLGVSFTNTFQVSLVDMNGDGNLDIVGVDAFGTVSTYQNGGNGSFSRTNFFSAITGVSSIQISINDFNGDGVPDLFTSSDTTAGSLWTQDTQYEVSQGALDLTTVGSSLNAVRSLTITLDQITAALGTFGAGQSRMRVGLDLLTASQGLFTAAASRITDVDVAEETANLVRQRIIHDAATAILAQANQQPAVLLQLLK